MNFDKSTLNAWNLFKNKKSKWLFFIQTTTLILVQEDLTLNDSTRAKNGRKTCFSFLRLFLQFCESK